MQRIILLLLGLLAFSPAYAAVVHKDYVDSTAANSACVSLGLTHGGCHNYGSNRFVNVGPDSWYFWPYFEGPSSYCPTAPYSVDSSGTDYKAGQCGELPYSSEDCAASGLVLSGGSCVPAGPSCADNEALISGECVPQTCALGKVWTGGPSGGCAYPETPPTCGPTDISVVNSSGATVGCHPTADLPDTCDYSLGYGADGYFLCSDQKSDCEAGGGTHGYVDGTEVCIPEDYSPPTCDSSQAVMLDAGGFVCSTPQVVKPQNPDDVVDPSNPPAVDPETPTTPSGQSGTATAPASGGAGEADEGTREVGKTGEARSSGSCVTPPVCSGGDPQVCALLRQQWEAMCKTPDMLENLDGNQSQSIVQSVEAGIDGVFSGTGPADVVGTVVADPTGGVGSAAEMGWFETFVADLVPSGTSCTSYSINMPRVVLVFGCERLDWLKSFLGWMLYCYTVFFVWGTVFAPYKAPAGG